VTTWQLLQISNPRGVTTWAVQDAATGAILADGIPDEPTARLIVAAPRLLSAVEQVLRPAATAADLAATVAVPLGRLSVCRETVRSLREG
jgi:hypothetical protein